MKGAIVFIAAFLLFVAITLGYQALPPGRAIYDAVVGAETDYEVLGISATQLSVAVFNGVVYGFIAWIIYSLADRFLIPKEKKQIEVKVGT